MTKYKTSISCEHGKTHRENVFIDLEDDGTISYDIMEICDACGESWLVGDFSDNGQELSKQMFPTLHKQDR